MANEDRRAGVTLSARDYVRAIRPSGDSPFARPFRLVPPSCDKQYRSAQLGVERTERAAQRRLEAKLDDGDPGGAVRAVDTVELARLWSSFGYRICGADLSPQDEEKLHHQLAAVLSGETSLEVWHATVSALQEVRRAAEVPVGVPPRQWRQVFSSFDYW